METNHLLHRNRRKGVFFGLLLIIVGAWLIGMNVGLIDAPFRLVFFSWQMLLIIIGISALWKRHWITGALLCLTGGFFILPRLAKAYPDLLPALPDNFTSSYWAVLLICAGILCIVSVFIRSNYTIRTGDPQPRRPRHRRRRRDFATDDDDSNTRRRREFVHAGSEGYMVRDVVFGQGEYIVLDAEFHGGRFSVVFGGITLDLRKTTIREGKTNVEITAVFGGVTLYVPEEWIVEINSDMVMAGMRDLRNPDAVRDTSRRLILTGSCVMSGGEIKSS
ncbi:MAG: cell wall-active antibiotics response protein [Prevotellaceae bacterium]|jgi:predicted membrane protein|nr:cell wall-active antibiotics response protein [Prevotellaceae bacterium]